MNNREQFTLMLVKQASKQFYKKEAASIKRLVKHTGKTLSKLNDSVSDDLMSRDLPNELANRIGMFLGGAGKKLTNTNKRSLIRPGKSLRRMGGNLRREGHAPQWMRNLDESLLAEVYKKNPILYDIGLPTGAAFIGAGAYHGNQTKKELQRGIKHITPSESLDAAWGALVDTKNFKEYLPYDDRLKRRMWINRVDDASLGERLLLSSAMATSPIWSRFINYG